MSPQRPSPCPRRATLPCPSGFARTLSILLWIVVCVLPTPVLAAKPKPTGPPPPPTAPAPPQPVPTEPAPTAPATPVPTRPKVARPAAPSDSTPAIDPFEDAVNAFEYQDFDRAIPQLRALLYPKTTLDRKRELQVREYLGAALWWQNDLRGALDEFTGLMVRNQRAKLDPARYPPKMVADFEAQRANLIRMGVIEPEANVRDPEPPRPVEPPPVALLFFPFGVGQFANQQPTKGWILLGAETVLASASVAYYLSNRDAGLSGSKPLAGEVIQLSTGAAFWLVAGWGIVDAWNNRKVLPPVDAAGQTAVR